MTAVDDRPYIYERADWMYTVRSLLAQRGMLKTDFADGDWRFDWELPFTVGVKPHEAIEDALAELRGRGLSWMIPDEPRARPRPAQDMTDDEIKAEWDALRSTRAWTGRYYELDAERQARGAREWRRVIVNGLSDYPHAK